MHQLGPGVEEHETARPIGVLCVPWIETGLAEERRLLVTEDSRHGHAGERTHTLPEFADRGTDLAKQRRRHPDGIHEGLVPVERLETHQHRARGIGHVGGVNRSTRQLPEDPGVDGAEGQFACLCPPP